MKTQKLETLSIVATYREIRVCLANYMRRGFNFNGVFMKTLAFVFLLFVLSCKSDVVEPIIPQQVSPKKESLKDERLNSIEALSFSTYSGHSIMTTMDKNGFSMYGVSGDDAGQGFTISRNSSRIKMSGTNPSWNGLDVDGTITATKGILINGESAATQDWVIKSAITLGTYKHKTFGGINVPCQELIINGERTGLYVLSPDK